MNIKLAQTSNDINQAYQVRMTVFVDEQKVPPDEEVDEHDKTCLHFVGYEDEEPIAASRLRFTDNYGKLERICILKKHRGKSHGTKIIRQMEEVISSKGYRKAKLNAQTHAVKFYQRLGYEVVSGEFMDAGIPHVTMVKHLSE
ncbi:GNAT family N-acetyltransferase [Virgibacillus sp. NKC19-3]|uniref:GNAT family N-acetyltransferase n=1 Tax=Virgibacillus saliphilus TaxID=2831674 RepID=UPI001C9AF5C5|nr:GNAT family N-acetyltransferase [Virgibacillus sp. NKC19-3]MBY7143128.1 GNAT family N-acetyltransferase [Virgibacillus sp. NKC19-3]